MSVIVDLGRAVRRVTAETKETRQWPGDKEFHVRIDITGLERPESGVVIGAMLTHEQIAEPARMTRDDELAAERKSYFEVDVVGVKTITAASSMVLDALRAALADLMLADKVEGLSVVAGPSSRKEI